ncbi:MAG TPA: cupredoxin domain-containing protein [Micropepsaceae bacterium]
MRRIRVAIAGILIALATRALAADAPPAHQDIQIVLSNFSFMPNILHLQRNIPTTLHLMNSASGGHAFSAPELFAAVTVAPEDKGKIMAGKIEVPAGQIVDITVTPTNLGTYPIVCTHFLHQSFGMRGQATIE